MHDESVPKIRATFVLAGDHIDFDYVTNALGVDPSSTRSIHEWPESINHTIPPDSLKPHEEWVYQTKRAESWSIGLEFDKIINVFGNRENVIRELCKKLDLSATISIGIHMAGETNPELFLERPHVDFLSSTGADFGIDLYIYALADGGIEELKSIELE